MATVGNENLAKNGNKYNCTFCNYNTCKKYNFDMHLKSIRHNGNKMETAGNENLAKNGNKYQCLNCNKKYCDRTGLWKHNKKCNITTYTKDKDKDKESTDKDKLIDFLIQEHSDIKNLILEIVKKDTISNSHNTNTNSLNKTFNLQFFLNETCKDAMNIMEFVESIQLQLSDLEKVGEQGYVEGISNIIINNLKGLDVTQRPIHCTDKKREVLYVKDEDIWQKEEQQNDKIRTAVKKISDKNMKLIPHFQKMHPDCNKSTSKISDKYNTIIYESMGGKGDNINEKENKIITNISKEVIVDKI